MVDAWRRRFISVRATFWKDDEDDKASMTMALEQLQQVVDLEPPQRRQPGGSYLRRAPNLDRDRILMDERLWMGYFSETLVYGPIYFRCRFRMRRSLLNMIIDRVCTWDHYFVQKRNAIGTLGLSPRQEISIALRMLALGICVDAMDEYCRTSESTTMESKKCFCKAACIEFGAYQLRQPTRADLEEQMAINKEHGFSRMFASIDCMHYEWKNCPMA